MVLIQEIQRKLNNTYRSKLDERVRRMRKLYSERNWRALKVECGHIKKSSKQYGYLKISSIASRVESELSTPNLSKNKILPNIDRGVHEFFNEIDVTLADAFFH